MTTATDQKSKILLYRALGTFAVSGVAALMAYASTRWPWFAPVGTFIATSVGTYVGKLVGRPMHEVTAAAVSAMAPDKVVEVTAQALRSMPPAVAETTTRQLLQSIPPDAARAVRIELIPDPNDPLTEAPPPPKGPVS